MKLVYIIVLSALCFSCSEESGPVENPISDEIDSIKPKVESPVNKADLVHVEGNVYSEYYPNKTSLKFQGTQDEEGKRHGKWLYFSENGVELSMTMYSHGDKHGHSIVKYPNGVLHYTGEYKNNEQIGIWKTYSIEGELVSTKDFGSGN